MKKENKDKVSFGFFRPTWKKAISTLILGFLVLILLLYLSFFRTPNKITPLVVGTILLAPAFLLFLFVNLKLRMDIPLLAYLILEIIYLYLLVCGFLWIKSKVNNPNSPKKKIVKILLIVLIISLILIFTFQFWKGIFVKTPYPDNIEEVVIGMSKDACFGTCPVYSITIYGNGTVIYNGQEFVKVPGQVTYSIPQEDVKSLVDYFIEVNYFALEDHYSASMTDMSSTSTSIKINGQTKSVYNYVSGPKRLKDLENKIYEISQVEQFVGNIRNVQNPEECDNYPGDLKIECYSQIIRKFENESECSTINNEEYRNMCIKSIQNRDLWLCDTEPCFLVPYFAKADYYNCTATGGNWKDLGDSCKDSCNSAQCIQYDHYNGGCDCGEDSCWNGQTCQNS